MTTEQLQAHLRLLQVLPVRTHKEPDPRNCGHEGRPSDEKHRSRKAMISSLVAQGWKVSAIAKHMELTRQTVYNYTRKKR
jgi:DNA-binding NarL/FixJ family response regulator